MLLGPENRLQAKPRAGEQRWDGEGAPSSCLSLSQALGKPVWFPQASGLKKTSKLWPLEDNRQDGSPEDYVTGHQGTMRP